MPLGDPEKRELLALSRRTLENYLVRQKRSDEQPKNALLLQSAGAFVTLEKEGRLRGCIGHLTSDQPLWKIVQEMTIQAATADPRFPPVQSVELPQLQIEISVLSPLVLVRDPAKINVGEHGLLVVQALRRGILLPQVPVREKWDRETFLNQTCLKAGLPEESWRKGVVEIYSFTAQVFSEQEFSR